MGLIGRTAQGTGTGYKLHADLRDVSELDGVTMQQHHAKRLVEGEMCRIRQCEVYASLPAQPLDRDEKSQMREEQAVVLTCKSRAVSSGSG
jgi:hypothetical protein